MAQWALQQGKWVWSGKNAFSFFPAQHAMHAKGFPLTPLAFPLLCPQTAVGSKTSYELIEMKQSLCIAGGLRMLFANNMTFWAETEKLFLFLTTSHLLRTYPIMVLQETSSLFCPAADCYGFMVQKLRDQYCISSYSLENRRNRKSAPPSKMLYAHGHQIVIKFEICSQNTVCVLIWEAGQNSTLKMFFWMSAFFNSETSKWKHYCVTECFVCFRGFPRN